jgi:hypothetical protein
MSDCSSQSCEANGTRPREFHAYRPAARRTWPDCSDRDIVRGRPRPRGPASRAAAAPQPGPPLTIHRAPGAIVLDGDLSDAGWNGAQEIVQWYETNVGDNVEPRSRTRRG